jgi:uracil-DNA glycosylase
VTRQHVALGAGADFAGFRDASRRLLASHVPPDDVTWDAQGGRSLFGDDMAGHATTCMLPRGVVELVQDAVCHRDLQRYALCYTLLWRVQQGERALLDVASDPLMHRLLILRKAVRRDIHKMHAFLRFRDAGSGRFVAWYEPAHFILEAAASFFVERFTSLVWSIVTPIGSLHWDPEILTFGEPGRHHDVPSHDAFEDAWRAYYESVFNPARANPALMRQHMPKKYWRNMPETAAIQALLRGATERVTAMVREEPKHDVSVQGAPSRGGIGRSAGR